MTSENDPKLLITEIDRQLQVLSKHADNINITLPEKVIIKLPEEGNGYAKGLRRLRKVLDFPDYYAPPESEEHQFSADLSPFLWKIPTFSSPSLSFIQPEIMFQKELAMCDIRQQSNKVLEYTSDISDKSALSTWASREQSSLILIRGSSQSTNSLRHLSCEVVNHLLAQEYATAYILNNANIREHFKNLGAGELLRQIACQVLKTVTANLTIPLLIEILQLFHVASTDKDWFCILELMMQNLACLFIVIDASVLQNLATVAGLWIAEFNHIFSRLPTTSTACVKIMILTNREIEVTYEECLQAQIGSTINRALPTNKSRLAQTRKRTKLPLPFFIPQPTPINETNDPRGPPSPPQDSGADIRKSVQKLSVTTGFSSRQALLTNFHRRYNEQLVGESIPNSSVISSEGIIPSPKLHSRDDQPSSFTLSMTEVDHSPRHVLQAAPVEYRRRQEISVAIICALPWEADAVEVLCDKIYDIRDFGKAPGDPNSYRVAQIGPHQVVILYMPAMGKSNAAASGMNCLHSFSNIRLALLTGICGGVPAPYTNDEILLGDVIVSDRLVLYDFGRRFPEGFERKDTTIDNARKPLPNIAAFLSKLKTRVGSDQLSVRMSGHLDWLRNKSRHGQWASYPGISKDVSFEAAYFHKHHNGDCKECDTSARSACVAAREAHCAILGCDAQRTIKRTRHQAALQNQCEHQIFEPMVHFGAYASGDIVMKSGEDRDEISRREKVIAFEMEGAGIWDNLPTIIVKGVCDYADSHKNKDWQKYAATTAAACVKALLEDW